MKNKKIIHKKTIKNKNIKIGGEQLPSLPLPPISDLENIYKLSFYKILPLNSTKIIKSSVEDKNLEKIGGMIPSYTLILFAITDDNLTNFKRIVDLDKNINPYSDCVISALQIVGILDYFSSNILRITHIGTMGITMPQIEMIFSFRTNKNCVFLPTDNPTEFSNYLINYLSNGHLAFCGVEYNNGQGHAFLIGKNYENKFIKIDPQSKYSFCDLNEHECYNDFIVNTRKYYLLFWDQNSTYYNNII